MSFFTKLSDCAAENISGGSVLPTTVTGPTRIVNNTDFTDTTPPGNSGTILGGNSGKTPPGQGIFGPGNGKSRATKGFAFTARGKGAPGNSVNGGSFSTVDL